MQKKACIKIIFFALLIVFLPFLVFSSTEVNYPHIPGIGIAPPQDVIDDGSIEENMIFPLFVAYIFSFLLVVSILVAVGVLIYGGFLYILSADSAEKKKNAKEWILSAFHGVFIVLASYSILLALNLRFVQFEGITDIEKRDPLENIDLTWTIKNVYFQIPFGLLIEDAALNEKGRDKFYDILDAVYDAEDTADAIVWGGKDLLGILDVCPIGRICCGEVPFCDWPPIPFPGLIRPKLPRPDLECWWDNAIRSPFPFIVLRPPFLQLLPRNTFDGFWDIQAQKARIRPLVNELKSAMNDFFPDHMTPEHPLWELKKSLEVVVIKLENIINDQNRVLEFTIEAGKVTNEIRQLKRIHFELTEPPFKSIIDRLCGDWWLGNETLAKGTGYKRGIDGFLVETPKAHREVPIVTQDDIIRRHIRYNWGTMYHSGCLLVSTVMVLRHYNVPVCTLEAMDFAVANGYAGLFGGTVFDFVGPFVGMHGMSYYNEVWFPPPSHLPYLVNWLENRGPVVIGGQWPPWSMGGLHAVTLTGADSSRGLIFMTNSGASFLHSATFGQAASNMPFVIGYIAP